MLRGMILIGQYDSPFTRRVAVTLHTYRMPFERQPYSVFSNVGLVRIHNPLVRVPVLVIETDGVKEMLIDSGAIIDYLDEQVGRKSRAMIPEQGPERRRVMQLTALAQGISDKVIHVFMERYFHDEKSISKDWEERCVSQIETGLEALEAACVDEHWLTGERMSHADVMTGCMISHLALRVPDLWPENKYKKLRKFATRCEYNKAFMAAKISENETIPARS
jgi:glutathione S-transferase